MAKTLISTRVFAKMNQVAPQGVEELTADPYGNPCVTLTAGTQEDKDRLTAALLNGGNVFALLLAKTECEELVWKKYVVECAIGLMSEIVMDMSPNQKPPYDSNMSTYDIDINMLNQLRHLTGMLQHMVNSTSWHTGTYQPYDKKEFKKRLEQTIILGG